MELTDEQIVKILGLSTSDVIQVYSGINGKCCCGCSGTHTYNPLYKDIASEQRGYEVDDDQCSEKTVKRILNKIKKNLDAVDCFESDFVSVVLGKRGVNYFRTRSGGHRWKELNGRLYVVYFKPTDKEINERRARKAQWKAEQMAQVAAAVQGEGI